jgi:tRNA(Ile2)-agmatinylcytidine synthase
VQLHIGIDDTDSRSGGCTTYIAARLVEKLTQIGASFIDYPNIIRLNPNIPYKTRGNAAVALRVESDATARDIIVETVLEEVEENSHIGKEGTDPAVVILEGKPKSAVRGFARRALSDVIPERVAIRVIRSCGASAATYGSMLGLVGALGAVGQTLNGDHTFELVAYRQRQNCGTPRRVDEDSVKHMDRSTTPRTFNSYDFENRRMLVTPHGPDPVLLGIRGETAQIVLEAFRLIKVGEPIERWVIFRTNHGTDAHLHSLHASERIMPNRPIVLEGIVGDKPKRIAGGHVFFTLNHNKGSIQCAAFEPTGRFREIVARLLPGDEITAFGGVRKHNERLPLTINLEKIWIHRVVDQLRFENPICTRCRKHMKSAGRGQGFRCDRCSMAVREAQKQTTKVERTLRRGLYVPTPKANRHLTKPLCRYGQEKKVMDLRPLSTMWHQP